MKTDTVDSSGLAEALESLRHEVSRLHERIVALEAAGGLSRQGAAVVAAPAASSVAAPAPAPVPQSLSEEVVLTISAAIAAFLGKKPHIRQIRLIGSALWAQEGRLTIQASHALSIPSGRSSH
jgi:methylmalonyl-CoA carboxyltransferase large subunit